MRKFQFQNGECYHIYNRGVDKRDIFTDQKDFVRFLLSIKEFNKINPVGSLRRICRGLTPANTGVKPLASPLVDVLAYCLNKNHYHLLLKQSTDNGLSEFMKRVGGGYTCYFNQRNSRSGALFQGTFKSTRVISTDHLLRLSCYINGNPEIHKITKAEKYQWSSYRDYLGKRNGVLAEKKIILDGFKNVEEYEKMTNAIIKESLERKNAEKSYLE